MYAHPAYIIYGSGLILYHNRLYYASVIFVVLRVTSIIKPLEDGYANLPDRLGFNVLT